MDKDLKDLRNARWYKAFSEQAPTESPDDTVNRKATIVIEHLLQASDVAHTMQHWHIYRKWNEHLFQELLLAYQTGRAEKDPSEFWYKGELGFFDFYIILFAKKLKDCGVFGVSSDEYLNYAKKNWREWEDKGQDIVHSMVGKHRRQQEAKLEANSLPEAGVGTSQSKTAKISNVDSSEAQENEYKCERVQVQPRITQQ